MNDRGQLLLVTGFAIAVAIVALVLLLNTAIYTQNLATRSVDTGASDALAYRDTVADNLWPIVADENRKEYAHRSDLRANVSARIDQFTMLSAQRHLEGGASANVTNRTLHDGTRLVQDEGSREMTDATGSKANWTMANGVDGARTFDLNTTGGLENTTVLAADDEAFRVNVVGNGGSGNRWSVYVYRNLAGTHVAIKNGTDAGPTEVCPSLLAGPPKLNLTAGAIDGSNCDAIRFGKGATPPYEISLTYGNRSTGTYNATVNGTPPGVGNFNEPSTSPYEVPVVYGISVDVVYRTSGLQYRARIHLAPGGTP